MIKSIAYAAFIALAPSWASVPQALADQQPTDTELCEYAPEWAIESGVVCAQGDRIEEDDPRWDCHTMGNRRCGTLDNQRNDR